MADNNDLESTIALAHFKRGRQNRERTQIITRRLNGKLTDSFHKITHGEYVDIYERLQQAMVESGIKPHDHVGIFSPNRPRWAMAASACLSMGAVIVTVYPTLTVKEAGYIVNHGDAKLLFVGNNDQLDNALAFAPECPLLKTIVVFEPMPDDPDKRYISFDSFLAGVKKAPDENSLRERAEAVRPDDPAAIIYTSGTTGAPKGAVLTHANLNSQRSVAPVFEMSPHDVWLSHLPLCHSFGFSADFLACMFVGAPMGMCEGLDTELMREAMAAIRPTIIMSVPRLYEKLCVRVLSILDQRPKFARKLFWAAHKVGLEVFKYTNEGRKPPAWLQLEYSVASKLLAKVKAKAGLDNLRVAYGGGGPLAKEMMEFFNGLGIDIHQGYGLTETSPIATVTRPGRNKLGTVGETIDDVHVKLDVDGEVLIKGPNVMKGYYKNPEATAEAFTDDGWFRTGDIGTFDALGRLAITDRKKELIITSAGKNIAPMPIETAFNIDPYIERVILIGDNRNYLTALVSPNLVILKKWAEDQGLKFSSDSELVSTKEVLTLIQQRIDIVNADLARFETIKKFHLVDHEFTEANGVLTPSQKVKRRVIKEKYKKEIESMYKDDI